MIWALGIGAAAAATLRVPEQYSFQEALDQSADGDVIEVRVGAFIDEQDPDGVRIEGRTLTIRSDSDDTVWMPPLTIVGSDLTLVNLAWHGRGLNTGVDMQAQTTECPDADDGCMVVVHDSVITATNLVFDGIIGPAPLGIRDSDVTVETLTARNNVVSAVVYSDSRDADLSVQLTDVSITGYGTALKGWNWSPEDTHAVFHVDGCTLTDNWAEEYAPDVFLGQMQDARLQNCVLSGGTWDGPDAEGAGSVVVIDSALEIWSSEISDADGTVAGAIYATAALDAPSWSVALGLHGVQLLRNYAWIGSGGAVRADGVDTTVTGSQVSDNYADRDGGAFSFGGGAHRISNTRLDGNIAFGWGGDVAAVASPTQLTIERSWLCHGEATQGGQAVALTGGSLILRGAIVEAQGDALVVDDADIELSHTTAVVSGGALLAGSGGSLLAYNNVFVSDQAVLAAPRATETVDHNLWDAPQSWAGQTLVGDGGVMGRAELNPAFAPGLCAWDQGPELTDNSPGVDAGRPDSTDLDGTCPDMGAFGGVAPYGWDGTQAPDPDLCGGVDTGQDTGGQGDSGLDGSSPLMGGGCPGGLRWASALLLVGLGLRRRRP